MRPTSGSGSPGRFLSCPGRWCWWPRRSASASSPTTRGRGASATTPPADKAIAAKRLFEGIGVIVAVQPRNSRLVLTHDEIEGFMAGMVETSFLATPTTLLRGLEPGNSVRFTIDADKRLIVGAARLVE